MDAFRLRRGWWSVAAAAGVVLAAATAHADDLDDRFGSDEANLRNVKTFSDLVGPNSHFDLRAGIWFATLSPGPFIAVSSEVSSSTSEGLGNALNPAGGQERVSSAHGALRDLGLQLGLKGNELFFDYMSTELWSEAEEQVQERVDSPVVQKLIRQIAAEFRPDLGQLVGQTGRAWIGIIYGQLKGEIDGTEVFSGRNGEPYFGGKSPAPWETKLLSLEGGVFWGDKPYVAGTDADYVAAGPFVRYIRFSMPVVLGFDDIEHSNLVLQDGTFTSVALGARGFARSCLVSHLCPNAAASLVPFTGVGRTDLGEYGTAWGLPAMAALDLGVEFPFYLGEFMGITPYAGFRVEWWALGAVNLANFNLDKYETPSAALPDYLLWGPRVGLTVSP